MSKKTKLIAFIVAIVLILESEVAIYAIGNARLKKKYNNGKKSGASPDTEESDKDSAADPEADPEVDAALQKITWKNEEQAFHYTQPTMIIRDNVPRYIDGSLVEDKVYVGLDVLEVLDQFADVYGFEKAEDNFRVDGTDHIKATGLKRYNMQQTYAGYDVYGYKLIVMVNDSKVTSIRGNYYPNISLSQTTIDEDAICDQYVAANTCELVDSRVLIYIADQPQLAVNMITFEGNNAYSVFVNAEGTVLNKELLVSALGEDQPDADFTYTDGDTSITVNVKKAADEDHYYFYDEARNIYVISNNFFFPGDEYSTDAGMLKQLWALIELPSWYAYNYFSSSFKKNGTFDFTDKGNGVYEIPLKSEEYTSNAVRNNTILMRNFEDLYDYYLSTVGVTGPYNKDNPIYVGNQAIVTDGSEYTNAGFSSCYNIFLIGDMYIDSPDVFAHEFNHGCFYTIVGEAKAKYTRSINEAYSDIAGVCFDGDDWQLGENSGTVVRDISDPNAHEQPTEVGGDFFVDQSATDYDEHINNTIITYSAYLMYENGAFESRDEMFQVFYYSMYYLTPMSDFEDCAYAIIDSARNFGFSDEKIEIIIKAFIETKVLSEDYSFTGYVVDDQTGEALSGVYVSLSNAEGYSGYTITDESGKFEIFVKDTNNGELVILNTGYDKLTVTVDDSTADDQVYRLVPSTNQQDVEIIFVMDNSASMFTSDPGEYRKTIISSMLALMSNSGLHMSDGLVTFTAQSNIITQTLNSADDKNASILNLYQIVTDDGSNANSGTCGAEGLEAGMSLFSNNENTSRYIVFLSDGEDNRTGNLTYDEIISACNERGIHIYSIGLGSGSIDKLNLEKLASSTGGDAFYAENSLELTGIVQSIFYNLR